MFAVTCDDLMVSALNLAWSLLGSIPGLSKTFFSHSSSLYLTEKTGTSEALGKLGRGERVTWDGKKPYPGRWRYSQLLRAIETGVKLRLFEPVGSN